jgi:hypothetical protein
MDKRKQACQTGEAEFGTEGKAVRGREKPEAEFQTGRARSEVQMSSTRNAN